MFSGKWRKGFREKILGEEGWLLVSKALTGVVAFVLGLVTILSIIVNQESQRASEVYARMERIQDGLLSTDPFSRISATSALVDFASDESHADLGDEFLVGRAFRFPRESILRNISFLKKPDGALFRRKNPSALERYETLKSYQRIGLLGWYEESRNVSENSLDFSWVSESESIERASGELLDALDNYDFGKIPLVKMNSTCLSLRGAVFIDSKIERSSFNYASLERADFGDAIIQYSSFYKSDLRGANFSDSEISGSFFGEYREKPKKCLAFPKNYLDLKQADLVNSIFQDALVVETEMSNVNAQGASFRRAIISNSSFCRSRLAGAMFVGAKISKTNFRHADLMGADFTDAVLAGIDFEGADIRHAIFEGSTLDRSTAVSLQKSSSWEGVIVENVRGDGVCNGEICEIQDENSTVTNLTGGAREC